MSLEPDSPPQHETFVRLLALHEGQVRAYIRASLPDSEEMAEVMQNTSLVAWRKFPEQDPATIEQGFGAWLTVIARYEILKFRRSCARDRLVLDDGQIAKLCADGEALGEIARRETALDALDHCLEQIPQERRALLLRAYTKGTSISSIAGELRKSPDALYQTLRRLRVALADCVEGEIQKRKETA